MKIYSFLILIVVSFFVFTNAALGLSPDQKKLYDGGVLYFDIEAAQNNCNNPTSSSSTGTLPETIPSVWRDLILSVAPQYPDVDPRIVASVLWAENRGWPEYKTTGWAVSSAGAAGPWQFIPSSWASMGHDGDGDGRKDRDNPKDSVHAAFKHHAGSAGKPIAVTGFTGTNPESDFQTTIFERNSSNLLFYAAKYNGRGAPNGVLLRNFPRGENADYVIINYWLLTTNFSKGWMPDKQQLVDATSSGSLFGSNNNQSLNPSANICPSGNGVVLGDYAFPVAPQRKSENGRVPGMSPVPCRGNCHHDGTPAFDLSRKPGGDAIVGTELFAITNGTIKNIRNRYNGIEGCQSFQLVGSDGFWYWYGHIQGVAVQENQSVRAGQKVAVIGERRCTGNGSDPHLHIDRGCTINGQPQPGGRVSCRDQGIFEIINNTFNALPD